MAGAASLAGTAQALDAEPALQVGCGVLTPCGGGDTIVKCSVFADDPMVEPLDHPLACELPLRCEDPPCGWHLFLYVNSTEASYVHGALSVGGGCRGALSCDYDRPYAQRAKDETVVCMAGGVGRRINLDCLARGDG